MENHILSGNRTDQMHFEGEGIMRNYLLSLSQALPSLHGYLNQWAPLLDSPVHYFKPGDLFYIQTWKVEPLMEKWKGSYLVLLTTYAAVKVEGISSWIHYSRLKIAPLDHQWILTALGPLKNETTQEPYLINCTWESESP